ncbi:MAG: ATP-binding protein [Actinobacteria bacterium]|nr:ATP-binding protein [Actinomycetota bacterium]
MKWRLVAALLSLTIVVLAVQDIPLIQYLRTVETDRITTALERDSFVIAGRAEETLETPSFEGFEYIQNAITKYGAESGARVVVLDMNGVSVADSESPEAIGTSFISRPEIVEALSGSVAIGRRFSTTANQELLYVAVPIINGSQTLGAVRITFPASVVDGSVNERLEGISSVAGITLLVSVLVALLLALGITRRLSNLKNVTEEFTKGNYKVRAEINGGAPEIRSLARSFNAMADQLDKLITQQKAFAGDASHQLRTPLTALQLRLERATEMLATDPAGAAERIEAAMVETDRLQRLVEGLLVLSRSENADKITRDKCDAAQIARERFENWEALASEQGVEMILDVPESAMIFAIPGALEQVVDNYIDNALGIVPTNSKITVKISADSEFTKVSIIDEGPGIPEADIAKAFNRFWRARSDTHGSGLGLAIVDRLATASGGRAELVNLSPNGLSADAYFPTA